MKKLLKQLPATIQLKEESIDCQHCQHIIEKTYNYELTIKKENGIYDDKWRVFYKITNNWGKAQRTKIATGMGAF